MTLRQGDMQVLPLPDSVPNGKYVVVLDFDEVTLVLMENNRILSKASLPLSYAGDEMERDCLLLAEEIKKRLALQHRVSTNLNVEVNLVEATW